MVDSLKPILKTVVFSSVEQWDIKRFISTSISSKFKIHKLSKFINNEAKKTKLFDFPTEKFKILGISNETGMFDAYEEIGANINQPYIEVKNDFLAYNPYRINVGSIGIKTEALKHNYISPAYVVFSCTQELSPKFLFLLMKSNAFNEIIRDNTTGSVRQTLSFNNLEKIKVPIPNTIEEQNALVKKYENALDEAEHCEKEVEHLEASIEEYLFSVLGVEKKQPISNSSSILKTIGFKKLMQWGYDKNGIDFPYTFSNVPAFSIYDKPKWCVSLTRGKSPKYSDSSKNFVLNQKCNRWDEVDLSYTKGVDTLWLSKVSRDILTEKDDILINSTGEGTLGRASLIKEQEHLGLLYDSHMLCMRVNINFVNPQLLVFLINSSFGQAQIEMLKGAQATKQTELGIDNMKKILFPLPEIHIQNQIADHIIEIKEQIKTLRQKAGSLRERAKKEFEEAVFSQ